MWTPDYNGTTTKIVIPPFLPESGFELEFIYYRTTASGGNFILCQVNDEEAEDPPEAVGWWADKSTASK